MNNLKQTIEKSDEAFVEAGAELEHERWARWQQYMFSKMSEEERFEEGSHFKTGNYVLARLFAERWFRQINTHYSGLPENEKESDRKETRNYLPLLHSRDTAILEAYKADLREEIEELLSEEECDCGKCLEHYECAEEEHRRTYKKVLDLIKKMST